jgi:hypothetical protein
LEEDEAVADAYERCVAVRKELAKLLRHPAIDDAIADCQDWADAERECERIVEAHGHWSDESR